MIVAYLMERLALGITVVPSFAICAISSFSIEKRRKEKVADSQVARSAIAKIVSPRQRVQIRADEPTRYFPVLSLNRGSIQAGKPLFTTRA